MSALTSVFREVMELLHNSAELCSSFFSLGLRGVDLMVATEFDTKPYSVRSFHTFFIIWLKTSHKMYILWTNK